MTLREFVNDARKAVGVLTVSESAAVTFGLLGGHTAALVSGVLGVLNAAVTYSLRNVAPARDRG